MHDTCKAVAIACFLEAHISADRILYYVRFAIYYVHTYITKLQIEPIDLFIVIKYVSKCVFAARHLTHFVFIRILLITAPIGTLIGRL